MADARPRGHIRVLPPSDDPGRPPKGLAGAGVPLPPVILLPPEIIAAFDRIAVSLEVLTTAIVPDDDGAVEAEYSTWCRASVYRRGDPAYHLCTRPLEHPAAEHDAGHVAEVDGKVLACSTCTEFNRRTVDMVCETCGTDYAKEG